MLSILSAGSLRQSFVDIKRASELSRSAPQPLSSLCSRSSVECEKLVTMCARAKLTHSAARKKAKTEIRKVVVLQSQWRRKLAVRELRGLKAEAKSADKFKEISYQLENKVVELTQTLQKRTAENKELGKLISALEAQVTSWQSKHDEAHTRSKAMEEELAKPSIPTSQFEEAVAARQETERKMAEAAKRVTEQESEIQRLSAQLSQQTAEIEQHQFTIDSAATKGLEDASTIASLRSELSAVREQISRNNALQALTKNQREPPSPTMGNGGLRALDHAHLDRAPSTSRRRVRRHSFTGANQSTHARSLSHEEGSPMKMNPRAVSVMFPQNGPPRPRDSNGLPTISDGAADDIIRLLEDTEGLEDDVLKGLITELKIPAASLHNPPLVKEIIFPAHLISLVSNEMWKVGMIIESERFLANVMQAIQNHVMVSPLASRRRPNELSSRADIQGRRCYRARNLLVVKRAGDPVFHLRGRVGRAAGDRSRRQRRSARLGGVRAPGRGRQARFGLARVQHLPHLDARGQETIEQDDHPRSDRVAVPAWIHHI